ncbi:MAG TPA: hypothetical protein GXZ90_07045 [Clostridiales bacterium]|nr:hypothetical protein [Clostridiales bacterium]
MLDIILDKIKKIVLSRLFPIALIYLFLLFLIINRLFVLQIVQGTTHETEFEFKTNKSRDLKSTRGNIYDRDGNLLAYNELSFSVIMDDSTLIESNEQRNEIIHNLIKTLDRNGDQLNHEFYIELNEKNQLEFTINGDELIRFKKKAYEYTFDKDNKELTQEQLDATAEEVFEFLRYGIPRLTTMFNISDDYTIEEALRIMNIRFAIFQNYPKYLYITIASDVSKETVAAVSEKKAEFLGVYIQHETHRVYNDSLYFSHMLGYTGRISASEIEQLEANGFYNYNSTDVVGKSGLEREYENYLNGTKGSETVTVNTAGKVVKVIERIDPIAGNNLHLTIDRDLQISAYNLLEKKIASILISKIQPNINYGTKGEDAKGILIPIYEVYNALINNNVIEINKLNNSESSELEKSVYTKYENYLKEIFNKYDDLLKFNSSTTNKQAQGMAEYLDLFHDVLFSHDIILSDNFDKTDSVYLSYNINKTSLSNFIKHAISNNWIDLSKLDVGSDYYSTEEIYYKLMDYVKEILKNDMGFSKNIYKDLIFSYKLSGSEICLLLFDQGVLEYNQDDINKLKSGSISAYNFMIKQISALKITPGMLALEPCSGSIVITDVNTGDVLALVTYPSYDNNMLANRINTDYYNKLLDNKAGALNNRATTERLAPGSTYKMISAIAGLEEGVIDPNIPIRDLGIFTKVTPEAKCHRYPGTHGDVKTADALKVSCNYYFYEDAYRLSTDKSYKYNADLGLSKLEKYATMFGLAEKTGIEIYEIEPKISDKDPIRSAIGQGSNAFAPIHLSRYITTIANRGSVYNLTIINKILDRDDKIVFENKPSLYNQLDNIKNITWNTVQLGIYNVANAEGGSVYNIYKDFPLEIAAKTGTAEISKTKPNHAWFVSYAPFDNPEISLVVAIPNGYTSGNAAELGKEIYEYYYNITDLDNDSEVQPNEEILVLD